VLTRAGLEPAPALPVGDGAPQRGESGERGRLPVGGAAEDGHDLV
jgi:hypothetical protein